MTAVHHTGLTVSDLDVSLGLWRGALAMSEVMLGGRGIHVRDPDDHVLELFTAPPAQQGAA